MSEASQNLVIVGAGVSGVKFALALGRAGYEQPVTLISGEGHLPYDRPPLSKEVLKGEKDLTDVGLTTLEHLEAAHIKLLLNARATSLDREAQVVVLEDGSRVGYDKLVIATGVVPRRIPISASSSRVQVLNSADDCMNIQSLFRSVKSVIMVGAGFIGSEIAATARELGLGVTLVDATDQPMGRIVGPWVGEKVAGMHTARGVDVRMNALVEDIADREGGVRVTFTDGTFVDGEMAIVGVGSVPVTDWLRSSGLRLEDGIVVDEENRTNDPNIWAIGDIARVEDSEGNSVRHQHWTSATDQADGLARRLTGRRPSPIPPVDYVWSDLYGTRLQVFGAITEGAVQQVLIDEDERFLVAYTEDDRLVAMLGMGVSGKFMRFRGPVALGGRLEDALQHV